MITALNAVIKDGLSRNRAAILNSVSPSTLKDQLSSYAELEKSLFTPYLTRNEKKLSNHLNLAALSGYGKTHHDVMNLKDETVTTKINKS